MGKAVKNLNKIIIFIGLVLNSIAYCITLHFCFNNQRDISTITVSNIYRKFISLKTF